MSAAVAAEVRAEKVELGVMGSSATQEALSGEGFLEDRTPMPMREEAEW